MKDEKSEKRKPKKEIKKEEDKKEIKKVEKKEKKEENKKTEKALFIQRLFAYLIDIVIISFIAGLIAIPFVDAEQYNKYSKDLKEMTQKFTTNEISTEDYLIQSESLTYTISRLNGPTTFITVVLGVLYFVVFQVYNSGKTIGKKLLSIKVISEDGDLTINQMIFRSFIANSILLNIINVILLITMNKSGYIYTYGGFELIQYVITIVSLFMVMFSKEGKAVHDRLVHTKVVRE